MRRGTLGALAAAVALASTTASARAERVDLNPADFTTRIDNRWWPMAPGSRWRYRESVEDGGEHAVVVTVTDATRKIANGVTARVVRDTVSEHGKVIEDTFDWYAQDRRGNVWYLGEDTAEFENGKLVTKAGSFEAGVDGAMAGVIMPAHPHDDQTYREEYYKGHAQDRAEVLSTHEMVQTPFGRQERALLTKETTPLEPHVLEYKLYAPRIGPVLTLGVSGGPGEREELLTYDKAPARWMAKARTAPLGQGPT